jgi:hypothetical protein
VVQVLNRGGVLDKPGLDSGPHRIRIRIKGMQLHNTARNPQLHGKVSDSNSRKVGLTCELKKKRCRRYPLAQLKMLTWSVLLGMAKFQLETQNNEGVFISIRKLPISLPVEKDRSPSCDVLVTWIFLIFLWLHFPFKFSPSCSPVHIFSSNFFSRYCPIHIFLQQGKELTCRLER